MIRPKFLFSICAMAGLLSLSSCDKDNDFDYDDDNNPSLPLPPGNEIPQAVIESFNENFPNATNTNWHITDDQLYAVVSFQITTTRNSSELQNHVAWFALSNGNLNMEEVEIPFNQLPDAVKQAFKTSEYAQAPWVTDQEVDVLYRHGSQMETLYVIDAEKKEAGIETDVELYYTKDGILSRILIDTEKDDDYHEFLPQEPAENIKTYIEQHYPGARIIDLDVEHNGTEVEFIYNGYKHEALFDKNNSWLYTKTDYDFFRLEDIPTTEIPSVVIEGLRKQPEYGLGKVEDAEKYETKESKTYFCFEIETHKEDLEIYIDNQGNRMDKVPHPGGDPGNGGGIPVPEGIDKFIAEKYPNSVVTDRDYDDGYLEVEIIHEGIEKELKFNGANQWISTKWDILTSNLPKEVLDGVKKNGYTIPVDEDEAEIIEAANYKDGKESIYHIEAIQGYTEYELYLNAQGTILKAIAEQD